MPNAPTTPSDPATANAAGKRAVTSKLAAIRAASAKWQVPVPILVGVWGAESTWSQNPAGADNPFGFLSAAAAQYHYPFGAANFIPQAEAAAHLLHDLHAQYGSWDAALYHYSGGGYGLSHVDSLANAPSTATGSTAGGTLAGLSIPGLPDIPGIPSIPGIGGGGPDPGSLLSIPGDILDAAKALFAFLKMLTDPTFYLRVGEVIAGLILIHMGLRELSSTYEKRGARPAHRAAKTAAELGVAALV